MKIGLGFYRHMLTPPNFQFARQLGVEEVVVHLETYFSSGTGARVELSKGSEDGWGVGQDGYWTYETFADLINLLASGGLKLAAIENFAVKQWSDILLQGPQRDDQMAAMKQMIRDAGKAGVPCFGYKFSLAGVWGWVRGPFARGGAMSVGLDASKIDADEPIPDGMVWNMRYRENRGGTVAPVSHQQLWSRLNGFLTELLPVAEEAGVVLAAHPDDPPTDTLRRTARLVNEPEKYDRLIAIDPRPANRLELCLGSLQEMATGDVYAAVDRYSRTNRIGYIHFRNVRGKVPNYAEVFLDEGDLDMVKVVRILMANGYQGLLIPDHTPEITCDAPWHAGMAYAVGYMRGLLASL